MTRYEKALQEANRFLGEDDASNPQLAQLQKQKLQLQQRIDQIDKQRQPIVLQLQDINKKITQLGGVIDA